MPETPLDAPVAGALPAPWQAILFIALALAAMSLAIDTITHDTQRSQAAELRQARQRVLDQRLLVIEHDLHVLCQARGIDCE